MTPSRSGQLSCRSSSSKTFATGLRDSERMENMNMAIDQLKLKYQPIISQNAEHLEHKKDLHAQLIHRKRLLEEKLA